MTFKTAHSNMCLCKNNRKSVGNHTLGLSRQHASRSLRRCTGMHRLTLMVGTLVTAMTPIPQLSGQTVNVDWSRQIGTSGDEVSYSVAVDAAGNAYISGRTTESLGGPLVGTFDVFLLRYSNDGTLTWSEQFGTTEVEISTGIAVDAAGNTYVGGYTYGSLGGPYAGDGDAFLTRYNADETLAWNRQVGTSTVEVNFGSAVDATGNSYLTGYTEGNLDGTNAGGYDAYLTRYLADGTLAWNRQLGTT